MTVGIILAGGSSSRMGQPKALLPLGTLTMVEHVANKMADFCDQILIVTGAHHDQMLSKLPHLERQLVFNESYELGMFSSLRKGLSLVGPATHVLFTPVDFANVHTASIAALFASPEIAVRKPRWNRQSGHPVLIGRSAVEELLNAPADSSAKQILSTLPARYVDVDDPGVVQDCDTPADYQKLLSSWQASQ
jgi:molybdenum cofactor cytidylyltransferase